MGRTLHFTAKTVNGKPFTEKEINAMYETSMYYNSGEFKDVWTCENFFLDYYSYYPNWNKLHLSDREKGWDTINAMYDRLRSEGKTHTQACKEMLARKMICLHGGLDGVKANQTSSFTKTQGNEYNSMLVYLALCAISQKAPNLIITLHDEGDYLLCNLIIRQGKVMPDFADLQDDVNRWSKYLLMSRMKTDFEDMLKDIPKVAIRDMGLDGSYSNSAMQYLKEAIQTIKTIFLILTEQGLSGQDLRTFNLRHRDPKDWFPPLLFARRVNPDDFKKGNEENYTHIMSGFYGEYWGRNGDKDAEAESYRMTASIMKLLPKDCKMEILPKLRG